LAVTRTVYYGRRASPFDGHVRLPFNGDFARRSTGNFAVPFNWGLLPFNGGFATGAGRGRRRGP